MNGVDWFLREVAEARESEKRGTEIHTIVLTWAHAKDVASALRVTPKIQATTASPVAGLGSGVAPEAIPEGER